MGKKKIGKKDRDNIKRKTNTNKAGQTAKRTESLIKDNSKIEDPKLRAFLDQTDDIVESSYYRTLNRKDMDKKELFGITTGHEYASKILYTARRFAKYVYENHGVYDWRFCKRGYGNEYINEYIKDHIETDEDYDEADRVSRRNNKNSISVYITHLAKFEEMSRRKESLDNNGKKSKIGILSDKKMRETLKQHELLRGDYGGLRLTEGKDVGAVYRHFLKKSQELENQKRGIREDGGIYREKKKEMLTRLDEKISENHVFARLWEYQCRTGNRIDAASRTRATDIKEDRTHTQFGKKGMRYDVEVVEQHYLDKLHEHIRKHDIKPQNRFFTYRLKGKEVSTGRMEKRYQDAMREAEIELGMDGLTSHSARAYFTNKVYEDMLKLSLQDMEAFIRGNPKYRDAVKKLELDKREKRLYNDESYRKAKNDWYKNGKKGPFTPPKEWLVWKKHFNKTGKLPSHLDYMIPINHEELAATIASVESGHRGRLSILKHYINRQFNQYKHKYPSFSKSQKPKTKK
jgi:hypothetical protein